MASWLYNPHHFFLCSPHTGMNKSGLLKGGDAAFANKMKRNPNEVMSQLQKVRRITPSRFWALDVP